MKYRFAILVIITANLLLLVVTSSFTVAVPGSNLKPNDIHRTENFGPVSSVPQNPQDCTSLIVFMHGLGDRGDSKDGWLGTMYSYQMKREGACVILPTARRMYVQVAKQATTAWFDVSEARFRDLKQEVDVEEVKASAEHILKITKDTMKQFDIPWNRVVFAGFSQGGALLWSHSPRDTCWHRFYWRFPRSSVLPSRPRRHEEASLRNSYSFYSRKRRQGRTDRARSPRVG